MSSCGGGSGACDDDGHSSDVYGDEEEDQWADRSRGEYVAVCVVGLESSDR